MTAPPPEVSVVVPAWNSGQWLIGCLDALRGQDYPRFSVVVVDDASTDDSIEQLEAHYPEIEVLRRTRQGGFAVAANQGVRSTQSKYVALLNADTRVEPEWLSRLVEALETAPDSVGGAASRILSMSDPELLDDAGNTLSWYGSARKLGHDEPANRFAEPGPVFSPCAAAALYRRSFFEASGGFDETFGSYFEDVDLGLRGRLLGYTFHYVAAAKVLHQGHGSPLARARYVRLITKNRIATFLKNVPASLLWRHLPQLVWGQVYFFLAYRRPLASLVGYADAVARLGHILRQRRALRRQAAISVSELDGLLQDELHEPPLRSLVRRRLSSETHRASERA